MLLAILLPMLSSCIFFPRFTSPLPDLLISQDPVSKPLFVEHPPHHTGSRLWFVGHASKKGSERTAKKAALDDAFKKLSAYLSSKGYTLSEKERSQWLKVGPKDSDPHVEDRWTRVYKESSDKPFLHLTSIYLLLRVPRAYVQNLLGTLAHQDVHTAHMMREKYHAAESALKANQGSSYLADLRGALLEDRKIHSEASFPKGDREILDRDKTLLESSWRQALRALTLSLIPPSNPLALGESPNPPIVIKEGAHIRISSHSVGLSGLLFRPTLHPFEAPEHLVFHGMIWAALTSRPILSPDTIKWETHLLRQPPYHVPHPLTMSCSPTGEEGSGQCLLSRIHVPHHHGTIDGHYEPVPSSPLDRPFFRKFLQETILDFHVRFYHRRTLKPIILSLGGLPPTWQPIVSTAFIAHAHKEDLTFCLREKGTFHCPGGPPESLLDLRDHTVVRVTLLSEKKDTQARADFSISSDRLRIDEVLSDTGGIFWKKEVTVTGRGFSPDESTQAAWKECARILAKDLSLVYHPPSHPHPGEEFYDR